MPSNLMKLQIRGTMQTIVPDRGVHRRNGSMVVDTGDRRLNLLQIHRGLGLADQGLDRPLLIADNEAKGSLHVTMMAAVLPVLAVLEAVGLLHVTNYKIL
jgi:uncharacterized membrane protein (DUF2068 family)